MNDNDVQMSYGSSIWQFVPDIWRHWWKDTLGQYGSGVLDDITIESPPAFFNDVSFDISDMKGDIDSMLFSKLASACNKHLLPYILCPWGCTEFLHRSGYLPFDIVIQRYLCKCVLSLCCDKSKLHDVKHARKDYIRFNGDYDIWLLNPFWKVKPSLCFVDGKGPLVLSCHDHDGGCQKMMIHPRRQPMHILPLSRSDQLCHAV
eukprot:7005347-Ditylum_brightwellii.AAC.1